jgi:hypothetical protein
MSSKCASGDPRQFLLDGSMLSVARNVIDAITVDPRIGPIDISLSVRLPILHCTAIVRRPVEHLGFRLLSQIWPRWSDRKPGAHHRNHVFQVSFSWSQKFDTPLYPHVNLSTSRVVREGDSSLGQIGALFGLCDHMYSSERRCKHGAYTLSCLWLPLASRIVRGS